MRLVHSRFLVLSRLCVQSHKTISKSRLFKQHHWSGILGLPFVDSSISIGFIIEKLHASKICAKIWLPLGTGWVASTWTTLVAEQFANLRVTVVPTASDLSSYWCTAKDSGLFHLLQNIFGKIHWHLFGGNFEFSTHERSNTFVTFVFINRRICVALLSLFQDFVTQPKPVSIDGSIFAHTTDDFRSASFSNSDLKIFR